MIRFKEVAIQIYEHTQPGILMRWIFGPMIVIPAIVLVAGLAMGSMDICLSSGPLMLISLIVLPLFSSLTVRVSAKTIAIRFGIGLVRKTFVVAEIESAVIVRNRWYYGWGVKYTPHGWLYNVSGWDAVEIRRKNGKKTRIGTDEPQVLLLAINRVIRTEEDTPNGVER